MPRFRVEAIETIKIKVNISISAKTAEAAKRTLQKSIGKNTTPLMYDKWYADDTDVIEREVLTIKQEPSKAEQKAKRDECSRRFNKICERIEKYIKKQCGKKAEIYVQFSAHEHEDEECDLPIDNLDDVPVNGRIVVFDDDDDCYMSPVMENPTWLQLCHIANEQIKATGDGHHVFLESINVENIRDVPKWVKENESLTDDVIFCTFGMGS